MNDVKIISKDSAMTVIEVNGYRSLVAVGPRWREQPYSIMLSPDYNPSGNMVFRGKTLRGLISKVSSFDGKLYPPTRWS